VAFLVCMDESEAATAEAAGKECAARGGIDFSAVETCLGGAQRASLLQEASEAFNAKLPGRTTIPHTFVNEADVSPSYQAISSALCKDGSAAPACKGYAAECSV